jgi:hypothetical protein
MNLRNTSFSAVLLGLMTIAASAQEAAGGVHKKTLMDLFHEGGWVMYPITLCSVAMIWFIVDGYIRTSAGKLYPVDHVTQLRELFKKGEWNSYVVRAEGSRIQTWLNGTAETRHAYTGTSTPPTRSW